jgi:hypothetical protein
MSQVQDFISIFFTLHALIAILVDSTFSAGYYSLILGESYFNSKNYALSRVKLQKEENWITCVIWELVTKLQRK